MKLKVLQSDMSVVTVIICHMSDLGMHACLCDNRSTSIGFIRNLRLHGIYI